MTITLDVRDQLSRRNNASSADRTSDPWITNTLSLRTDTNIYDKNCKQFTQFSWHGNIEGKINYMQYCDMYINLYPANAESD